MSKRSKEPGAEELTFVVYHDASRPRSFRIHRKALARILWLVGIVATIGCGGTLVLGIGWLGFPQFFSRWQPASDTALQKRSRQLEDELEALKKKLASTPSAVVPATPATCSPAPASDTPTASPPSQAGAAMPSVAPLLFSALPDTTHELAPSSLPFRVEGWNVQIDKQQVAVRFQLIYEKNDGGHQQGRILILARGPGILLTHPYSALQPAGANHLLRPEQGEFFSVGRFREVRAEFPLPDPQLVSVRRITEIQVLLFNQRGDLMFQRVEALGAPAGSPPSSPSTPPAKPTRSPPSRRSRAVDTSTPVPPSAPSHSTSTESE